MNNIETNKYFHLNILFIIFNKLYLYNAYAD